MSSLGHRAHPFTAGAVALALIALALLLASSNAVFILYGATIVIAIGVGASAGVWRALLVMLPIWVLLFVLQVLLGLPPRDAAPWGGTFSQPGLAWSLSQGSRLAVIATASLAWAAVFDPHRFLQAAIARRWSFGAAFLVVATLDAADRLREQARRLREAQRTRGVRVSGSIAVRAHALPALLFPLLLAALTEADDRTLALETRGLMIHGPRIAIDPPGDTISDRLVRWLALAAVIAAVVWRVRR